MRAAASVLTPPMLNSVLDVVSYEDVSAIVEATAGLAGPQADAKLLFGVTDCEEADATLFPTCAGDMAEYRNDLQERQAALDVASASMTAVLGQLQEVTESVQRNVSRLMQLSDDTTRAMHDAVWRAGSCAVLHERYENVRAPLCEGVVSAALGVWALSAAVSMVWVLFVGAVVVVYHAVSARLPSRRLSFAESEYSLLLDLQPRQGGEDDEMLHSEDHLLLGGQESPRQAALEGQSA